MMPGANDDVNMLLLCRAPNSALVAEADVSYEHQGLCFCLSLASVLLSHRFNTDIVWKFVHRRHTTATAAIITILTQRSLQVL